MDLFHDKYSLTALAIILVIAVVCVTDLGGTEQDPPMVGVIQNVKVTESGNTFDLIDSGGDVIRCFYSETVKAGDVCNVVGSYSRDGNIFFISRITFI